MVDRKQTPSQLLYILYIYFQKVIYENDLDGYHDL